MNAGDSQDAINLRCTT